MTIWPQAALCPLSLQDPPPHSMDTLTLTPEAWSLPRPPLTHTDKWPHSLPPDMHSPCLSLAFCQRSASSYYLIDTMYFAQMRHSKLHQLMTGFEVPRLILYRCCVFLFCHAAENGVTNKTSQRLKKKACLIFFLVLFCQYIQVLESKLFKMEHLQFKKY